MTWFENILRDARLALRSLRAAPWFTGIAVTSLAIGIGAAVCVFSLANAIFLQSLPVPRPQDLRVLHWSANDVRMRSFDGASRVEGGRWTAAEAVSHPAFLSLRAQAASDADIFGFYPLRDAAVTAGSQALIADGMMVSENLLSGLQVKPRVGRLLRPGEDYAGGAMHAVIGHTLWQRLFNLDPRIVGRSVTLNGTVFTIVGVLEPGFTGIEPGRPCEFYVPMSAACPFLYTSLSGDWHWFVRLMARLEPRASETRLAATLAATFAGQAGPTLKRPTFQIEPGAAGLAYDRDNYRRPLFVMLAVASLVLLAACANVAGLLVARGSARSQELAVRAALGGTRRRLFQQSIIDSLLIALLGGGLGVILAMWGKAPLADLLAGQAGGLRYDVSLDPVVLTFSLAVTLAAALLAGLIPAARACRPDPIEALRTRTAASSPRLRAGRLLVVAQVCLSLLLVTSAGLFVRTLLNLTRVDPGFRLDHMLLVSLNIRGGATATADPAAFYDRLQTEVARLPGVVNAAIVEFPLLGPGGSSGGFSAFTNTPAAGSTEMSVRRLRVGETFFATMEIPIVEGRALQASDSGEMPKAVVVNEAFVHSYLRDRNAIGLAFRMWEAEWRIVGVCRDAKYGDIRERVSPTAYFPYKQMFYSRFRATHLRGASIAVRTALAPLALSEAVRKAVARVDPGVGITAVTTQEHIRDRSIARERLVAVLCAALAGVALLLSWVGLFALTAYTVGRRTGEIGIRMALGATLADITRPIVGEALLLAAAGVAIGLPVSVALARLATSQLFGVSPGDPLSITLAAATILATTAAAAWIPARRAQRIEPTTALRRDG
jgi:predicted permease